MIAPGTILQNRYLVEEQIGQGGMGAVFVATDQRFGSRVALKETFFTDPNLRKAFEREARLLNRLRHHALPRVSDHFTEEEGQFLVMEYIAGSDLSEMLKARGGQPFPLRDVLEWADQLLDALDYLHTQEPAVIHRDIKPQNLKLTARNQIVLLDFGLAKGTPLQSRVTATGSVLGYSLNYAPLEQMQGAGTDPRSDLYSLGATLHHLSTGATPPDALTRATALVNGDEDPLRPANEVHAQVTPAVGAVLARAMSQSAARRFASAAEMRDALRDAGRDVPAASDLKSVPPALAATLISEQETRLLNEAGTAHVAGRETEKEANVNRRPDAPALTDAPHAAPHTAHAAPHAPTSVPPDDSVVTSVRADSEATSAGAHESRARAKGRQSLRAVGIGVAAGVVVLALIAVYAYTRRAAPPATVEQPPARLATPSTNTQPAPTVESQPQTVAAPSPSPSPVAAQPTPRRSGAGVATVTTRGAATANENRAARGTNVVVGDPDVPEPPDPDAEALRELQALNNNAGLTPQQIEAIRQRAAVLRRRAIQQRRMNERQRRRRRLAPLPPPTP
jgi:serine/threonine protein kinase